MLRKWKQSDLSDAVKTSRSIRQVLVKLGLRQAGGNYAQIKKYIRLMRISTAHFLGTGWSRGLKLVRSPVIPLDAILRKDSDYQSFKLKKRLFASKLKNPACEECGWDEVSPDGRLPLELDHMNGDSHDNRLENLRVLCPNCHSLKPTHRGRNIRKQIMPG
ncbi:MAG TPA: HNH endonuclease [Candidatus Methylomirabilis sp.]|nr:HNH endonuclease [Candidatus Methylomirabilis sp.]